MILICFDGSTDAEEAIVRGASLLMGESAIVLTVWQPFDAAALGLSGGMTDLQESDEANRKHAEQQAHAGARLATEAGLDASPRTVHRQTTIAEAILNEAEALEATAILMGSRGLTGVKSLLLGSASHAAGRAGRRPFPLRSHLVCPRNCVGMSEGTLTGPQPPAAQRRHRRAGARFASRLRIRGVRSVGVRALE